MMRCVRVVMSWADELSNAVSRTTRQSRAFQTSLPHVFFRLTVDWP